MFLELTREKAVSRIKKDLENKSREELLDLFSKHLEKMSDKDLKAYLEEKLNAFIIWNK